MSKKKLTQTIENLRLKQKSLNDQILKLENQQLLKIGKLAKRHDLTNWDENSLIKAFKFLEQKGQKEFQDMS